VNVTSLDIGDAELERIAALGWRGLEEEWLGDWLLRAGGGFTGRANSVLPLGDPGVPLPDALRAVEDWYGARRLPLTVAVPLPLQADLYPELLARGWRTDYDADVLVADVATLAAQDAGTSETVRIDARPDEAWLSLYHYRGGELPPSAIDVLTNGDTIGFASVIRDGAVVAVGRGAVAEGWLGLTAIEVAHGVRRQGLGAAVIRALVAWGGVNGARSAYLQVSPENAPALALYARLGFGYHHRYVYLFGPG
jgi:N-acetylglutamate synthase